jgi:hypothetical protein
MEWLADNVETLIVVLTSIVALTPTEKDDGYLGRVVNLLRAVSSVVKGTKK